ncbi:uncharacterized protein LOC111121981 isoform X2 [Crassostrea virginica]
MDYLYPYAEINEIVQHKTNNAKEKRYKKIQSIYDWYHPDQTERSARKFLDEYPYEPLDYEAMFMVHPYGKGREDVKYVISCKWKRDIYQYRVRYKEDFDLYTVGSATASSLIDLMEQYRLASLDLDGLRSLYRNDTALSHLKYPIQWPKKYKDRCYHGLLGREEAERVLQIGFKEKENCSPFLIRDSYTQPGELIVSCMFVNNSDFSKKFHHCYVNFQCGVFEALKCQGQSLLSLAENVEEMYKNYGSLMNLKAINREKQIGKDKEYDLPPAITKMDESAIQTFRDALEEGHEHFHHVRVMVVGYHGAGKSSLTKRLLRENVEHVQSTDGVEIFTKRGRFQLSDYKWIKYDGTEENKNETMERIARYMRQRFPEGIPQYMSDSKTEECEPSGLYQQPAMSPKIEQNPIYKTIPHHSKLLQQQSPLSPQRTTRVSFKSTTPNLPPRSHPDPRVGKIQPESDSDDDSEDEEGNISYSNNFATVISDLKKKFASSNEAQAPLNIPLDENDYAKGSDDWNTLSHGNLNRSASYDEDSVYYQSQREKTLRDDLEELLQMSEKFLENETGSITFWDFAGQTVFQTTHQAFMSPKAVYLLVTNASRPMCEQIDDDDDCQCGSGDHKTVGDFLKFWLNTIHTYGSESQQGSPKVLVVSTHKDNLQNMEKDIEEHHRAIKKVVQKKRLSPHLVPEMFCVDCYDNDEKDFDKIRSKILEIAGTENILSQDIPTSWIYLERTIVNLQNEGKKVLSFSDIQKLNRFCALKLKDEREIKVFLQFHHAIGNMLYYDEKGLDDIIILNPQWLVDAFKCLITSEKFVEASGQLSDSLLKDMKKTGHLSLQNIEALWGEKTDTSYLENKEHIIKILERMDIISRPRRYMEDGESCQEMSTFLVPCMMNVDSSNNSDKWLKIANKVPALGFYFKDEFMPPAVFFRLLAACMAKFPAVEQKGMQLVFANTAVFRLDKLNFLLLVHDDFLIRAWVLAFPTAAEQRSSIRYTIKKFLEESLTIILEIYTSCSACPDHKLTKRCTSCRICTANFPFQVVVQCPRCLSEETTFKGLHFWEDLISNESVVCFDHDEVHVIESSDILAFWECPTTTHKDNLSMSRKGVSSDQENPLGKPYQTLGRLARRVSGYWEQIAYQLDLGDNFVETTKQNFPHLASDCCFHTLRKWFDKSPKEKRVLQSLENVFVELDIDREALNMLDTELIPLEENKYLERNVTNRGIDIICNQLGKRSYQLAIELGLTPEEIERIQMDFPMSIDRSRKYLNKWRLRAPTPTYKVLLQALATVEVDNYMDILKRIY